MILQLRTSCSNLWVLSPTEDQQCLTAPRKISKIRSWALKLELLQVNEDEDEVLGAVRLLKFSPYLRSVFFSVVMLININSQSLQNVRVQRAVKAPGAVGRTREKC